MLRRRGYPAISVVVLMFCLLWIAFTALAGIFTPVEIAAAIVVRNC